MSAWLSRIADVLPFSASARKARRTGSIISRLSKNNLIDINREDYPRVKLRIAGSGNTIRVSRLMAGKGVLNVVIVGSGCTVEIGDGLAIENSLKIFIGNTHPDFGPVKDVRVSIGKNTAFNGDATIMTYNSHAAVEIGDKCLFGAGVVMYQTDGHPIYDLETGRITNRVKTLHIGNHVWTGSRTTYLKNSFVADDSIVGFGSVVTRRFPDSNVVISGNPAACVRTGVEWKSCDPAYIANERD